MHVKICITCCISPRSMSPLVLLLVTRTDTACDTDFAMYYALFNIILSLVYYRKYVALAIYDFTV